MFEIYFQSGEFQVTSSNLIGGLISSVIPVVVAAFLFHYLTKQREKEKREIEKREKYTKITELLAEWLSNPNDNKTLNQLSFEAFVWLPKETVLKLNKILTHKPDAPSSMEIIADVRSLLNPANEKLNWEEVVYFDKNKEDKKESNNFKSEI